MFTRGLGTVRNHSAGVERLGTDCGVLDFRSRTALGSEHHQHRGHQQYGEEPRRSLGG